MATYAHPHEDQVKVASGLDVIAAIWLFISAFSVAMTHSLAASNAIVGVVVFVLACIRAFGAYGETWLSWVNAILGLWVLVSPWILQTAPGQTAITNNVITGIVIIVLAVWSALATNTETPSSTI